MNMVNQKGLLFGRDHRRTRSACVALREVG
jgi:hypothetical protein